MKLSAAGLSLVLVGCASSQATAPQPPATEPAVATTSDRSEPDTEVADRNAMLERAMVLYARQDYRAAAEAFQAAYAHEESPSLLLAQAQALRLAGDCESALPLYERFLATQTDPTYTNAVRPMMEACLDAEEASDSAVARVK